jgi:preprotein translocase subunit SecE
VSNDHDGVTGDGQEPNVVDPSDEAAAASTPPAGAAKAAGPVAGSARKAPDDAKSDPDEISVDGDIDSTVTGSDDVIGSTAAVGTGAVSAGAARAAARRSAARAGVSEAKGAATPKRAAATTVKRPNVFARFGRFLREVVAELRKVIWPTRNQMVTYTIVVIVFVVFMVALVGVLDLLFAKGVLAVFG